MELTAFRLILSGLVALGLISQLPPVEGQKEAIPAIVEAPPARPVVPTSKPVPPVTVEYLDNTIQNCDDVTRLLVKNGWPADQWAYATKIAHRESRCQPGALNNLDPMGGSVGLFQINMFWCLPNRYSRLGWLQEQGVIESCDDLYNATLNIRAALAIWQYADAKYGNGWGPWTTAYDSK